MKALDLGSLDYRELLTFVWVTAGAPAGPRAAFVVDGRDYPDAAQARAAVREALEETELRVEVADFRPAGIAANEGELAHWPSWPEFRRFLDVYGPVYPWRRPRAAPAAPPPAAEPAAAARVSVAPDRFFECWGQLVEVFPRGQGPEDPVLGRRAAGYGLNGYTGEFEADTRRAVQCARGVDDDETWPLRDESEFVDAVEERREELLRTSFYQRHDKPEIFAAYERGEPRRVTYAMWRAAQRRRAFYFYGTEPVRVDLTTPGTAWRLDPVTGRLVPGEVTGDRRRITEHEWLLAVAERRRALDVGGAIAEAYAKAAAEPEEAFRNRILTGTLDLWAEKFGADR
ncbi:hypothetical protein [Amycolatopsis eburnea]|uniref:Uncharacterized protein n=1 Tax=Amycolatopsis eburnea TaxID=2267691 RepID=A0A427TH38_9PSEU|nr:hypothetical protein [Amycolatopsis eburnea]RSD22814.1 hypothetical protein EIY87_06565 [Amycolatopsis eburnea]